MSEKEIKHRAGKYTIYCQPVPRNLIVGVLADMGNPPEPPMVEVEYVGGHKIPQPAPNDPEYLAKVQLYDARYNSLMASICVAFGIKKVEPMPEEGELENLRLIWKSATGKELFYKWVLMILGDTLLGFINLVLGQTEPMEREIAETVDTFRPDS
jgi:hypothetical protein